MIAVCSIGCERKALEGFPSWPGLFALDGDYSLYFNYEMAGDGASDFDPVTNPIAMKVEHYAEGSSVPWSLDLWRWGTVAGKLWRAQPQYDQDQARLAPIAVARNMCRTFAHATGASHLLFIDADVIPPSDVIPKLLAMDHCLVGGVVPGRGCHSKCQYIFGEQRRFDHNGIQVIEVDHGTCGCMMIERRIFNDITFRYSNDDGLSEDPAFTHDVKRVFGENMWLREDVVCTHVGDLKENEASGW